MALGVPLVRPVHRWELDRIANEKDGLDSNQSSKHENPDRTRQAYRVVENPVKITFVRVELHCPSVDITRGISRARLGSDR